MSLQETISILVQSNAELVTLVRALIARGVADPALQARVTELESALASKDAEVATAISELSGLTAGVNQVISEVRPLVG